MTKSVIKLISCGLALWLATLIFPAHASYDSVPALLGAAVLLWLINLTVRPLLKLLTIPIGCLTLGLSFLFIDTLMVWIVSELIPGVEISGFFVMLAVSMLISLIGSVLSYKN